MREYRILVCWAVYDSKKKDECWELGPQTIRWTRVTTSTQVTEKSDLTNHVR